MDDLFEQLLNILQRLQDCEELDPDDAAAIRSMKLGAEAVCEMSMDRRLEAAGINPNASDEELAEVAEALTGAPPGDSKRWN